MAKFYDVLSDFCLDKINVKTSSSLFLSVLTSLGIFTPAVQVMADDSGVVKKWQNITLYDNSRYKIISDGSFSVDDNIYLLAYDNWDKVVLKYDGHNFKKDNNFEYRFRYIKDVSGLLSGPDKSVIMTIDDNIFRFGDNDVSEINFDYPYDFDFNLNPKVSTYSAVRLDENYLFYLNYFYKNPTYEYDEYGEEQYEIISEPRYFSCDGYSLHEVSLSVELELESSKQLVIDDVLYYFTDYSYYTCSKNDISYYRWNFVEHSYSELCDITNVSDMENMWYYVDGQTYCYDNGSFHLIFDKDQKKFVERTDALLPDGSLGKYVSPRRQVSEETEIQNVYIVNNEINGFSQMILDIAPSNDTCNHLVRIHHAAKRAIDCQHAGEGTIEYWNCTCGKAFDAIFGGVEITDTIDVNPGHHIFGTIGESRYSCTVEECDFVDEKRKMAAIKLDSITYEGNKQWQVFEPFDRAEFSKVVGSDNFYTNGYVYQVVTDRNTNHKMIYRWDDSVFVLDTRFDEILPYLDNARYVTNGNQNTAAYMDGKNHNFYLDGKVIEFYVKYPDDYNPMEKGYVSTENCIRFDNKLLFSVEFGYEDENTGEYITEINYFTNDKAIYTFGSQSDVLDRAQVYIQKSDGSLSPSDLSLRSSRFMKINDTLYYFSSNHYYTLTDVSFFTEKFTFVEHDYSELIDENVKTDEDFSLASAPVWYFIDEDTYCFDNYDVHLIFDKEKRKFVENKICPLPDDAYSTFVFPGREISSGDVAYNQYLEIFYYARFIYNMKFDVKNNETEIPTRDQMVADSVIALIDAIGEVAYNEECKSKIDSARAAFDKLTDSQMSLVTNVDILEKAEKDYKELMTTTGVGVVSTGSIETVRIENFSMSGSKIYDPVKGITLSKILYNDGSVSVKKLIIK